MKVEFSRTGNRTNWAIIFVLILAIIGLIRFGPCQHAKRSRNGSDTITIVEYDSIPRIIKAPAEVRIVHDTVTLPGKIDTVEVIRSYFTRHIYNRSFLDSEISINQVDTVFENQIYAGPLEYKILRPKSINTKIINNHSKSLQFGVFANYNCGLGYGVYASKEIGSLKGLVMLDAHRQNLIFQINFAILQE